MYLRGNIGIDAAELSLFWLGIGSIACAFLYQAVEIGVHIWSIAQRREHPVDAKVFNSTFQMFAWAVFGSILTLLPLFRSWQREERNRTFLRKVRKMKMPW
jgi:hypothetical protein